MVGIPTGRNFPTARNRKLVTETSLNSVPTAVESMMIWDMYTPPAYPTEEANASLQGKSCVEEEAAFVAPMTINHLDILFY